MSGRRRLLVFILALALARFAYAPDLVVALLSGTLGVVLFAPGAAE